MSSIGPQIPEHLLPKQRETESDEDDYTPALPPQLAAARKAAGPSLRPTPTAGPSTRRSSSPRRAVDENPDSNSDADSDVGPQPLPAYLLAVTQEKSGVQEFLEREERRKKNKLVREEWMLVPPKAGDLLGSLDPTKLKARQFGRGSAPARDSDTSLWTETPAERQQRLADEVSGRKRRAANAEPEEDPDEAKKRRRRDAEIRRGVDEHTLMQQRKSRGHALVDAHLDRESRKKKDKDEPPPEIWDHSRDMSLGGQLMDDKQRQKLLRDAKGLGDRFGTGKSGGFL
ncbi:hypothetical protein BU15DRAFT_90866 [Melanogaster broomeanus]|nr:hypothetical protein BU15DRAFT_90866 [Melanogaster broomeanus]